MTNNAMSTVDRRRHPRIKNLSLFIYRDINAGVCMGRTLDVSQGGVQVETYEPLFPGSGKKFEVVMNPKIVMAKGTVVHSIETEQGVYLSGIEFEHPHPDVIRSLTDQPKTTHP